LAAKEAAEKKPIRLQHAAELNERSRQIIEILQGKRRDRQIESFGLSGKFSSSPTSRMRENPPHPLAEAPSGRKGRMKQLEKPRG